MRKCLDHYCVICIASKYIQIDQDSIRERVSIYRTKKTYKEDKPSQDRTNGPPTVKTCQINWNGQEFRTKQGCWNSQRHVKYLKHYRTCLKSIRQTSYCTLVRTWNGGRSCWDMEPHILPPHYGGLEVRKKIGGQNKKTAQECLYFRLRRKESSWARLWSCKTRSNSAYAGTYG